MFSIPLFEYYDGSPELDHGSILLNLQVPLLRLFIETLVYSSRSSNMTSTTSLRRLSVTIQASGTVVYRM